MYEQQLDLLLLILLCLVVLHLLHVVIGKHSNRLLAGRMPLMFSLRNNRDRIYGAMSISLQPPILFGQMWLGLYTEKAKH